MSPLVAVRAWLLAEGDEIADGQRVVTVQRDPPTDRVVVSTDDGRRRVLYREDRLVAVHRRAVNLTTRQGVVCAFLGRVRHRWE